MKYVKKIAIWFMFFVTAIALYIVIRNRQNATNTIDTDFRRIYSDHKRIKDYLDTSASNIRSATKDNSESLDLISRLEANNEKFRIWIQELQKKSRD